MQVEQSKSFQPAQRAARRILRSRPRTLNVVHAAYRKAVKHRGSIRHTWRDLYALLRMVHAWARGEYRAVPWRSLALATAALIYFVNPVDLIPDLLAYIGFTDDMAVVSTVLSSVGADLRRFLEWESARPGN